jgi:uncharacterized membrane protein YfcA
MEHVTPLTILLFLTGGLAGVYSSVVGGGALLVVPALTLLGAPLAPAIATMRVSSVIQQLVCIGAFRERKGIDWKPALWIGVWCMPGAYLGAHLVLRLSERTLSYVVAVLMVILLVLTFHSHLFDIKKEKKGKPKKRTFTHLQLLGFGLLSMVIGIYGGFYGAGFSTLIMFFFWLFTGTSVFRGSGDASVVSFFMAIASAIPFIHARLIHWDLFWPLTLGGVIGCWVGVGLAAKYGIRWIRPLLVVVVVASVIKLLFFK